jgi:hypothetical protein
VASLPFEDEAVLPLSKIEAMIGHVPDTHVVIVELPSYEAAMKNNDLPATATIADGMAALADQPPTFRNLDLIRTD